MSSLTDNDVLWYAMSATYRSEMKIRDNLVARGVECYLPLHTVEKTLRGRKVRVDVPLVSNLIFVHSSRHDIQKFKQELPHLQYKMWHAAGQAPQPITVRERDMANFMTATVDFPQVQVKVLDRPAVPAGARVRITGGPMNGLYGILSRQAGSRSHRITVTLDRLCSLQIVIPRGLVEFVDDKETSE